MELHSYAFSDGDTLDEKYAYEGVPGGKNLSPDLTWSGAPAGTQSYALTCFDPDAPTGSGWWHWIAWDLPEDLTALAEGEALPTMAKTAVNDYGEHGYGGPNPPAGPAHRYVFTVYSFDVESLEIDDDTPPAAVRFTLLAKATDQASITGMFAQPE